ncbi:Centrosomal protein of 128 kDa [Channa argus]|uniref:Centrosomal protein of 128 kDa n=1 Tax=Channa argus TaxID=215402 RepID=A0A6G1QJY4_CHAAH|nr:Centrosomal protein of 128 kDa [Channa argus]
MDTSSESDSYDRTRGHRLRGREAHRRPGRDGARASRSGGDNRTAGISEKINTLANTLQDTSRNLTKVDRMLGQYREHTDEQAEAMTLLRENLEESISQLQTQRLMRSNGVRSASGSASTLQTSDLEACSGFEGQRFYPTSPLRDYRGTPGRRRRSQSAGVRFKDTSLSEEDVSTHVERRLQELEREMNTEHRIVEREKRPEQHVTLSDDLQETLERRQVQAHEKEAMTARLLKAEREKSKLEQELEGARKLLEQSEDNRVSLVQQVEDMRGELRRTRKERTERVNMEASQPTVQPRGNHTDKEEGRGGVRGPDRLELEKEIAELRVQLCKASVLSEVEELKRALDRKEKERVQLSLQVEELSSGLARREQQQLRMLEQLREMQAVREKESSQAQLKALSQQTEAARRELAEILGRLAQREEELHRKDVELSESRQRQLSLEQEIREVREASTSLEEQTRRQEAIQARLREENQILEERAEMQVRYCQRDQEKQAELQAALKQMNSAHAQLAQRLAEVESSKKDLQKSAVELQAKLTVVQEERATTGQQLQLEREVHQKELDNMKAMLEDSKIKKDKEMQDMIKLCHQEREEAQAVLKEVKADAASDKELCEALRIKLDRMKDECDKLAAQLSTKDDAHALLHRKYQLLKQELDDNIRTRERKRTTESELEERALRMEAEQEAILTSMGEELDAVCCSLARNGEDKLQAIAQKPGLVKDPHRWLAETKIKLQWLCEEVRERDTREERLRKQHQQTRDQLKALRQSRDSEQAALLHRLDQQEKLLHSVSVEKKDLLERSRRKEEEMRSFQDRVLDLEMKIRVALNHLESVPEKLCLVENFRDLEESQRQREMVEQRYTKYKEIVWDLQHQLDESKRRIQEYQDEKLDATSRSLRLAALSSSIKGPNTFLSSSLRSETLSPLKHLTSLDLDDSAANGAKLLTD